MPIVSNHLVNLPPAVDGLPDFTYPSSGQTQWNPMKVLLKFEKTFDRSL
jgi:hypothetical protein